MIQIPVKLRGLRVATALLGLYFVVWIVLEGSLWQTVVLGGWGTAVSLAHLGQGWWGGNCLRGGWWVVGTAVTGAGWGIGTLLLTLFFMALKTGLHAHGPEFTPHEIAWVIHQLPLWGITGLLAGAGVGLIWLYITAVGSQGH